MLCITVHPERASFENGEAGASSPYWVPCRLQLVAVCTVPPDQVCLIGSTGLDSGLVLMERSVKERVGVLRDSGGGLLGTVLHTRQDLY